MFLMRGLLLAVCLLMLFGCKKEPKKIQTVYDVPAEFQPLVSKFIKEAEQRGQSLSISNLIIQYDSTVVASYCAVCNSVSTDPSVQKIISVNPKLQCYHNSYEQETLFFHELGHCVLNRPHDNNKLPNGDPKSIMVPANINLYGPCQYPIGGSCPDNTFKRPYYIDELFNQSTPVPAWAR